MIENGGSANGDFIENDRDVDAFMIGERLARANVHAVGGDFDTGVLRAGAISAGECLGANIGGAGRKQNASAGGLYGNIPVVAGDVPVELIVIVCGKAKSAGDGVFDGDGLARVVGVWN